MEIDPATGSFDWTSPETTYQQHQVIITVTDGSNTSTSEVFVVTVQGDSLLSVHQDMVCMRLRESSLKSFSMLTRLGTDQRSRTSHRCA
jgi:hypothetical protein